MPTPEEYLQSAAQEALSVGGSLALLLQTKRGLKRSTLEGLIEQLNNARAFLEEVLRR
jgi:uncharacterized protein (DUF3820 family)